MSSVLRVCTLASCIAFAANPTAHAQSLNESDQRNHVASATGAELWMSSDSEKTAVVKLTGRALWNFEGPTDYKGVDVERAWFSPEGQHAREQTRAYLDIAGPAGAKLDWSARLGTNGYTVLGSASIRTSDWSKELFAEREIVETPRGVDDGIYYTLLGASADLVSGRRDTLSAMTGVQKFTGKNARLHLRGTYVHVIKPKLGLSLQLRIRYFHSTAPGEFDYYSPRDFIQLIPVVQFRRFNRSGWMYLIALGYGAQLASGSQLQSARLSDFRLESPKSSRRLQAFAEFEFSNNSLLGAGGNYHYAVARLGLTTKL